MVKNIKLALICSNKQVAILVANQKSCRTKWNQLLNLFHLTVFLQSWNKCVSSLENKIWDTIFYVKKQSDSNTVTLRLHNCSLRNFYSIEMFFNFHLYPVTWPSLIPLQRVRERAREKKASCRVLILANSENLSFSVPNNSRSAHPACKKQFDLT